jgi:hypothetical protein
MILHRTHPRWEAGEVPGPELIQRVGALLGELGQQGRLLAAEGLRASAQGARLRFQQGTRTLIPGPFPGEHELPAHFEVVRVASLREATEWATRLGTLLGDGEVDVRPITEPWDIGLAPPPSDRTTGRYLLLHKATAESEAGRRPARERAARSQFRREMAAAGVLLAAESLGPSSTGRRLQKDRGAPAVLDGPFTESKELLAGYVLIRAPSLDEAVAWGRRYLEAVESHSADVFPVDEPD